MSGAAGDEFDYVVVGGGSAGCLLAARLSEEKGVSVCLLEAGPADRNFFIHVPAGFIKVIFDPKVTWSFETDPVPSIKDRKLPMLQGRVLGGSGSINGMVYTRGQAEDFDSWAGLGNPGWAYREILPYFRRSEHRTDGGDDRYRGRSGGLKTLELNWPNQLADAFLDASIKQGIPANPDYNGPRQEGVGRYQYTIENGKRCSAARAFLRDALERNSIDLRTDAQVTAVTFEGKVATGVSYLRGNVRQEVRARREVILCAGAANTPKLLQISGIGPRDLLGKLGIPVVHELAGVGANLQDHYTPRFLFRAKPGVSTINGYARGLPLAGQIINWLIGRPSILGIGVVLGFAYTKSRPELERPDILITFTPGSFKAGFLGVLDDQPGMTCGVWQLRPESRGFVHARSADPLQAPAIQPNYLSAEADQQTVVTAMKLAKKIMAREEIARYCESEMLPGTPMNTDADWLDFARSQGLSGYHICGTAKMGPASDPMAVVDEQLRVRGLQRLRVADASVMPLITSGNTNAATMMIAEKAADMLLGRPALVD
jgi:choline dehydrogenase